MKGLFTHLTAAKITEIKEFKPSAWAKAKAKMVGGVLIKHFENLAHKVDLYFMRYNFCRIHQTLRVSPAMESGITDHV